MLLHHEIDHLGKKIYSEVSGVNVKLKLKWFFSRTTCSGLTPLRWRTVRGRVHMTLATMLRPCSWVRSEFE